MDITFDLNTGSCRPYRKPDNDARYINAKSDHPPSVLKQIPAAISRGICTNLSNKLIFENAAPCYNSVLKDSGYKEKIWLKLVKKHFSKHRPHKIFNKNNTKVSYSCMVNIEKLVKKCNNNLLRKSDTNKQACNYCTNNSCPLDGKCLPSLILFIQLKFSLATINKREINILVSARQNSKPD